MHKLLYKLEITGTLQVLTGLHIGGSEVELDIGGVDNEVIKIKQGDERIPYIPGSSLKGKLRALLGRHTGKSSPNEDVPKVGKLFGKATSKEPSRLIIRDAYAIGDVDTEDKAENTIDRLSGGAKPRHMERVVKGARFGIDMMMDIYQGDNEKELLQTLNTGFQILQMDYLGGSGTRGYGKVKIMDLSITKLKFEDDGTIDDKQQVDYEFQINPQK